MTDGPEEPQGTLRPISPGPLVALVLIGCVLGYVAHNLIIRAGHLGLVSWAQVLVLYLLAAILAGTAWSTWRTIHVRRERLESHRAVNRLVTARASALVGALLAGLYGGYAASWVSSEAALAGQRVLRSTFGSVAGLLIVTAAIALERACRVRKDDD